MSITELQSEFKDVQAPSQLPSLFLGWFFQPPTPKVRLMQVDFTFPLTQQTTSHRLAQSSPLFRRLLRDFSLKANVICKKAFRTAISAGI